MMSRRTLLASLGLALPAVAVAAGARAATSPHLPHSAKHHVHAASAHTVHHHKAHRVASATPGHVPTQA